MDKLLDLTRDFDAAKAAFEAYLDEYDRADDKIHLKIVHTYGVVDAAEDIARRMGLGEEDVQLAKVIGLLHDIGRFEQIKRFDSFEPGNHGACSIWCTASVRTGENDPQICEG